MSVKYQAPLIKGDYRVYTDYRPPCQITQLIMNHNGITNSYDLKTLLTNNALKYQELNRQFYASKVVQGQYYIPDPNHQDNHWNVYKRGLLKQVNDNKCQ
jgi:hypothetical protein